MAKPNISPLTFRPSEKSLAFIDWLRAEGLTTTDIIQAALYALSGRVIVSKELHPHFDVVDYIKDLSRNA